MAKFYKLFVESAYKLKLLLARKNC